MKPGAVKMRYPSGDPENGPAYMQRWDGKEWSCAWHKPEYDYENGEVHCKYCHMVIMDAKAVDEATLKTKKRRK
jgi:nitrite reductase/ring-hydroxylating ferredoxin subunit